MALIKIISYGRFFITIATFFASLAAFAEKPNSRFYRTDFGDLTQHSIRFQIPFDFVIPADYAAFREPNKYRFFIMHKIDAENINRNGGEIDPKKFIYPFYYVESSTRFGYADGKFSVERDTGNFQSRRADKDGYPVLVLENEEAAGAKFILVHPNYVTWVMTLHFFGSQQKTEFSKVFWEKIVSAMSGKTDGIESAKTTHRIFTPVFPDSARFAQDIYRQEEKSMPFPAELPRPGKTSQRRLEELYPRDAIRRRYSFPKPVQWQKGKRKFEFDTYIEYAIQPKYKVTETPDFRSTERLEHADFVVFLRNGLVAEFDLIRYKNVGTKEDQKEVLSGEPITGDFRTLQATYLKARSSLFRTVVADRRFYEDYLALPEEERAKMTKLHLEYVDEFPAGLSKFVNLRQLSVSNSKIAEISCANVKEMSELRSIDLWDVGMGKIPDCFAGLKQLTSLRITGSHLKAIPKGVLGLPSLRSLDLSNTGLTSLPAELSAWTELSSLNLSQNMISEVPASWVALQHLREINLSRNKLERSPATLGRLIKLHEVNLQKNMLRKFPDELVLLPDLTDLHLEDNRISELSPVLCQSHKPDIRGNKTLVEVTGNPIPLEHGKAMIKCAKSFRLILSVE